MSVVHIDLNCFGGPPMVPRCDSTLDLIDTSGSEKAGIMTYERLNTTIWENTKSCQATRITKRIARLKRWPSSCYYSTSITFLTEVSHAQKTRQNPISSILAINARHFQPLTYSRKLVARIANFLLADEHLQLLWPTAASSQLQG